MSKEGYLKDDDKEKALELVRQCLAYGFSTDESLIFLKENGIAISDRTLRRYKEEIQKKDGALISRVFRTRVINNFSSDIYAFEQIKKEAWKAAKDAKNVNEKIRALTCIRQITIEKIKLYNTIPVKFHNEDNKTEESEKWDAIRKTDDMQKKCARIDDMYDVGIPDKNVWEN